MDYEKMIDSREYQSALIFAAHTKLRLLPDKQMQVKEFANRYVCTELRGVFARLMQEHDGLPNYHLAFYDMDVLLVKLEESEKALI
jgi:hypothetical protein